MSGTRQPFIRPPFNEIPLAKDTGEHTMAWKSFHEEMADQVRELQANAGVTDASNAEAGQVGEYLTATSSPVSLTTGVGADVVSLALTAGDWDVIGNIITVPAGATTTSLVVAGISTATASITAPAGGSYVQQSAAVPAGQAAALAMARRVSLAAPQSIFLVGQVLFGVSTMQAYGFLAARRAR